MIFDYVTELLAGYISEKNEIYSDAPDYIKDMARQVNKEYKEFQDIIFFKFTDKKSPYNEENAPEEVLKARKELEKIYN